MKRISVLFVVLVAVGAMQAVPAYRGPYAGFLQDGTNVCAYRYGDEFFSWFQLEDGAWVTRLADGSFMEIDSLTTREINQRRSIAMQRRTRNVTTEPYPLNIAPRGLIILVSFKDLAFTTPKQTIDSMMMGKNFSRSYSYADARGQIHNIMAQGSAWQYFHDVSMGQYSPQFDVVGPVTVSKNMKYYGQNDSNDQDMYAEVMVQEACRLAQSECGVDFSVYDNDNDGEVDFVYVIYAGYGEADTEDENTIWPHSYWLSETNRCITLNDKKVDLYACGSELNGSSDKYDGIGTFCHEFSHVLGLPDMYTTSSSANFKTLGSWDIMDYGPYNNNGNTPPSYSAYERFFMGWLTPELLTESKQQHLENLTTSNTACLITTTNSHNLIGNDPNPKTFYLLENRQQMGWDSYIPGHGLMITKINYSYSAWENNTVNNSANSQGVDIIEADGKTSYRLYSDGKATDLFPAGATEYTKIENHYITDITEDGDIVRFNHNLSDALSSPDEAEEQIVGIYTITGIPVAMSDVLPQGVYVVRTANNVKKIIIQ